LEHDIACDFNRHSINLGVCKSLNEALGLARGKFIAMLAADDVMMPDKIARQVRMMQDSPEDVGVIYSDALQIDEDGKLIPGMFIASCREFETPPEGFLFDQLWQGNFIPAMTTFIRSDCFEQVGRYDEDLCFEDLDMWFRISRKFRFIYDPVPAAKCRILATSMTRTRMDAMNRSIERFKLKYFLEGWLTDEQEKGVAVTLAERFGIVASYRTELINCRNGVEMLQSKIRSLENEIEINNGEASSCKEEVGILRDEVRACRDEIQKQDLIIKSARDWQKKSLLKRTFHKWRGPGSDANSMRPLARLSNHLNKGLKIIRLSK